MFLQRLFRAHLKHNVSQRLLTSRYKNNTIFGHTSSRYTVMAREYSTQSHSLQNKFIQLNNVSLVHGERIILDDINLSLNPGEKRTIVGPNGVGKSTLLKIMCEITDEYTGTVSRVGDIGYLPQFFQFDESITALEHILRTTRSSELMALLDVPKEQYFSKSWFQDFNARGGHALYRSMNKLELPQSLLTRDFSQLSGGEKTKAHLAALEICNPDFLLLDEPTNHLDTAGINWLMNFIKYFQGGVVMITHDRKLIEYTSNRISELSPITHQLTHFSCGYKRYLEQQFGIMQKQENERVRNLKKLKDVEKRVEKESAKTNRRHVTRDASNRDKLAFNARGQRHQKNAGKVIKHLEAERSALKEKLAHATSRRAKPNIDLNLDSQQTLSVRADKLSVRYSDDMIFNNLSFELANKDRLVITGHNGSGKTTLLNSIAGIIEPDTGSILISGACKFGYLEQNSESLDLSVSPAEFISTIIDDDIYSEKVRAFLYNFGITHDSELYRPMEYLSIGCRRKTQLAGLIADDANILLLDEPTNHIDLLSIDMIEAKLLDFKGIVIAVSHDQYFKEKVATAVIELDKKNVSCQNAI